MINENKVQELLAAEFDEFDDFDVTIESAENGDTFCEVWGYSQSTDAMFNDICVTAQRNYDTENEVADAITLRLHRRMNEIRKTLANEKPANEQQGNDADTAKTTDKQVEELLTALVKDRLGIDTLETQNSDAADFHEVSVWELKEVLIKAFEMGRDRK